MLQPMHSRLQQRRSGGHPAAPWSSGRAPHRRRGSHRLAAASTVNASAATTELLARAQELQAWLAAPREGSAADTSLLEPKRFRADDAPGAERVGLIAARDVDEGAVVMRIPESLAITAVDACAHPVVGSVAQGCSELVALALWLLAERAAGSASPWAPLLATLPASTNSPILWPDSERVEMLTGSPVLTEARQREAALRSQWADLAAAAGLASSGAGGGEAGSSSGGGGGGGSGSLDPAVFTEQAFLEAFCVVLASVQYLPSAGCFALLPLASLFSRTGNENGVTLDYDEASGCVKVVAGRPYREGQEVLLNDGRPNGELLLATGNMQDANLSDCLIFNADLVASDKYYLMKEQVLASMGYGSVESFPVYADRFPLQLLTYLRLSRIQDPALFAKVSFESDIVVTQMNEYEVLQILMGECRVRLAEYKQNLEEDIKALQGPGLTGRARIAARLRVGEKTILSRTMEAVRRKLAPIRGIPTKSGGMRDPNEDLKEIFETIEAIPSAPAKLFDGLRRWARGEFDPDWKK